MRFFPSSYGRIFLLGTAPLYPAAADDKGGDSLLPATIPGYELRTLDVSKPVLFNVNGAWVQASLPVFFYYPTSPPVETARLLRQAHDDLLALARKPEWTGDELQGVLAKLDAALGALEPPAPVKTAAMKN